MLRLPQLLLLCLLPISLLTANENESVEEVVEEAIELRTSIYEIVETFTSDIAYIISSESFRKEDPESRRRMLAWALRTVPYTRSICYDNSAELSLVDFGITLGWLNTQLQRNQAENVLSEALELTRMAVSRAHRRIDKVMRERLDPESYTRFQEDLAAWIDRHPEHMSLRFGAISDLAIEHMDLDEDANLYTGISYEQRLLRDLKKSKGGGLFTGKLESSLQQTNIEVKEIELEMQRIADHLEWFPIYTSWVLQLTAIDYAESGPIVENLKGLQQLDQLGAMLEAQQGMADALMDLAASEKEFEPLVIEALGAIGKMDTHMQLIESALEKHEEHISQTGNALEQIAIVMTNRKTLISLAVITGASMGVAFMFCIIVYKSFGERRKEPKS